MCVKLIFFVPFFPESICHPTNLTNPVASSTPSNSKPPSRTPLSVLPINRIDPNPPPAQLYNVFLRLIKSHKRDYTTVSIHGMRAWDTLKQLEAFIKSKYSYALGDSFLIGYMAGNTHVELHYNEDVETLYDAHRRKQHIILWAQGSSRGCSLHKCYSLFFLLLARLSLLDNTGFSAS